MPFLLGHPFRTKNIFIVKNVVYICMRVLWTNANLPTSAPKIIIYCFTLLITTVNYLAHQVFLVCSCSLVFQYFTDNMQHTI